VGEEKGEQFSIRKKREGTRESEDETAGAVAG